MDKEKLLQIIARCTREVLPELESHSFTASDRLVDLGANSVDRVEITMLVQEALDISIPRVALYGSRNIGELADLFLQRCQIA